jgi:DNA invertase Pin-like site-specific DNA recombinase
MQQNNLIAGIYLRISDDREGRELGVTRQREHCIELAERLGIKVYYIYNDNDRGASRYSSKPRKDYQRLLRDAQAGVINCIIAYTTGRLTRRPREHEDQIDLAQDLGVQYHYVRSPSFDLNTSQGRRIARILASNDAGEADDISERVLDAKRKQASKGLYLGGYRAYGYEGPKYNDEGALINRGRINVELVPHEVEVLVSAIHRIISGETPYAVMKDLNHRSIPSPAGKQWQATNLKRQLTKKRYVIFDDTDPEKRGTLEHHGKEYRAEWPGIITRSEYELMMARLRQIEQPWEHGLIHGRTYLLTGFIYCGACSGIAYGNARPLKAGMQRRYRCRPQDNSGNKLGCGKVFRVAEPLELYVTEQVLQRFDTPEVTQALGPDGTAVDVAPLAAKLTSLRQHKIELAAEYGRRERSKEEYEIMARANAEAIRQAGTELAKLQSRQFATNLPAACMLCEVWDKSSIEWRRNVLQLLVERVEILPHGHTGSATWRGWRFNPASVRIVWRNASMADVALNLSVLVKAVRAGELAA